MPRKTKALDFEQSLNQLEALVARMEQGDLSLDESLNAFEQGVKLTRECQQTLAQAEQKVRLLMEQNGTSKATPFDAEETP